MDELHYWLNIGQALILRRVCLDDYRNIPSNLTGPINIHIWISRDLTFFVQGAKMLKLKEGGSVFMKSRSN
jgi:hypothetical protein